MRWLMLVIAAWACGCNSDIDSGLERANDLLYRQQYVDAERLYRKLLKRLDAKEELSSAEEAQHLLVLNHLGQTNAIYLHDYPHAIGDFSRLVRMYKKTDQALAARKMVADIYQHKLGDTTSAIDSLQHLVAEFPNRDEASAAQLGIARGYFKLKNYEQARAEAETLIDRWPSGKEATQARFEIANSYYVQARYAEAIATYERLLEDSPSAAFAAIVLFEIGNCFQELEDGDRSLAYYYASLSGHANPMLVQRKIKRVRRRLHNSKPAAAIYTKYKMGGTLNYIRPRGPAIAAVEAKAETMPLAQPAPTTNAEAEPEAAAADEAAPAAEPSIPAAGLPVLDNSPTPDVKPTAPLPSEPGLIKPPESQEKQPSP